jgi:hypothetical protein
MLLIVVMFIKFICFGSFGLVGKLKTGNKNLIKNFRLKTPR